MSRSPILVLAVGNPSRGDDAIGPMLAERLAVEKLEGIEVLSDLQLNPEHALDIAGRERVLFVDASESGMCPYELHDLYPDYDASWSTHQLSPGGLLYLCEALDLGLPGRAELLAVRGRNFELGASPSHAHLETAWRVLKDWCEEARLVTIG